MEHIRLKCKKSLTTVCKKCVCNQICHSVSLQVVDVYLYECVYVNVCTF